MRRLRAIVSHAALALGEAGLLAVLVVAVAAGTALAAKGGGGKPSSGGGTLALVMVDDANSNAAANWNDTVTFTVTATTDRPFVSVNCYQNGAWVYTASAGFFADYPWPATYTLSGGSWPSGGASCTARLYSTSSGGSRTTTLATMSFAVGS